MDWLVDWFIVVTLSMIYSYPQEIELVFKPHPKDHDPETVAQQTRYIKTTANASGTPVLHV